MRKRLKKKRAQSRCKSKCEFFATCKVRAHEVMDDCLYWKTETEKEGFK